MTESEFQAQMGRLVDTFGKAAFPAERVRMVWAAVQALPDGWFRAAVDGFISGSRQAPMVADIAELASEEKRKRWQQAKRDAGVHEFVPTPGCTYCKDSGVFLCTHKTDPGFWAFRCHCTRGQDDPRKQIPHFVAEHAKTFRYHDRPLARPTPGDSG